VRYAPPGRHKKGMGMRIPPLDGLGWTHRLPALVLAGIVLALSPLLSSPVRGAETITIVGKVANGTDGQGSPEGLEVTLHVIGGDGVVDVSAAATEGDGRFLFPGVDVVEGSSYTISASYQEILYSQTLVSASLSRPVELLVYEASGSIESIRVQTDVLLIGRADSGEGTITAIEVVTLVNSGDRTFLPNLSEPGSMSFLRFSRPAGARELEVASDLPGGEVVTVGTGFAIAAPVKPGVHQVSYTYRLPYEGSRLEFEHSFPMGADTFQLLVNDEAGRLSPVAGLAGQPPPEVSGYSAWGAEQQEPGSRLTLRLEGLPRPPWHERLGGALTDGPYLKTGLPAALGLVMAGLLVYVLADRRRARVLASPTGGSIQATGQPAGAGSASEAPAPNERSVLVTEIARLDVLYEAGQMLEVDYQRVRRELKSRLLSLTLGPGAD